MALSKKELESLIIDFIKTQGMCVLATCRDGLPRASAVEFFPEGTTLYILTEGGLKLGNLAANHNVSVAIHTQFTGTAKVGNSGSSIFNEGVEAYKKRRGLKSVSVPEFMSIIKVTPQKIEYLDTTLKAKGLDTRHILEY